MHTLPHVTYAPVEEGAYFVQLLDRVLVRPRPVRSIAFGLNMPPGKPDEAIMHTVPRFILGLDGSHAQLVADGHVHHELPLRRGEVIFFPPLGWNVPQWHSALEFFSTIFYADHTRLVHGRWSRRTRPRVVYHHTSLPLDGTTGHLVSALSAAAYQGSTTPGTRAMVDALLWDLRRGLALHGHERPRKSQRTWQGIASYLQEHLHQPLSLNQVASHFGLHPAHISRLARSSGREGFVAYLTRLRMERAELLISKGGNTLQDISLACGFTDYGYFRKVFLRFFGRPPSQMPSHPEPLP